MLGSSGDEGCSEEVSSTEGVHKEQRDRRCSIGTLVCRAIIPEPLLLFAILREEASLGLHVSTCQVGFKSCFFGGFRDPMQAVPDQNRVLYL